MSKQWPRWANKGTKLLLPMTQEAFYMGAGKKAAGLAYRNPFPPGKRHDEFKRGYACAAKALVRAAGIDLEEKHG